MTQVVAPPSGGNLDKITHMVAYAVLTSGMVFAWPKRSLFIIFAFAFSFGVIIEIAQGTVAIGRTASLADAIANGVGILAIILFWMWICPRLKHYLA